jgi:hypothetical protein
MTSDQWNWPKSFLCVVHLRDGRTVHTDVNGRNFAQTTGSVYVGGRVLNVWRSGASEEWEEVPPDWQPSEEEL